MSRRAKEYAVEDPDDIGGTPLYAGPNLERARQVAQEAADQHGRSVLVHVYDAGGHSEVQSSASPRARKNPHGQDPVITLEDLIEQLELWNENTDGSMGGEDIYVVVWDDDPDPEKNEWTISQFFSKRELEAHKKKYGGKYAKLRIPGHDKPFNAHRAAVDAFEQMGLRIMNPTRRNPADYQRGQQAWRKGPGLTRENSLLIVAEGGLLASDNKGRTKPAVKAWQPAFDSPGDRPYTYLLEEIRPASTKEQVSKAVVDRFLKGAR